MIAVGIREPIRVDKQQADIAARVLLARARAERSWWHRRGRRQPRPNLGLRAVAIVVAVLVIVDAIVFFVARSAMGYPVHAVAWVAVAVAVALGLLAYLRFRHARADAAPRDDTGQR